MLIVKIRICNVTQKSVRKKVKRSPTYPSNYSDITSKRFGEYSSLQFILYRHARTCSFTCICYCKYPAPFLSFIFSFQCGQSKNAYTKLTVFNCFTKMGSHYIHFSKLCLSHLRYTMENLLGCIWKSFQLTGMGFNSYF